MNISCLLWVLLYLLSILYCTEIWPGVIITGTIIIIIIIIITVFFKPL